MNVNGKYLKDESGNVISPVTSTKTVYDGTNQLSTILVGLKPTELWQQTISSTSGWEGTTVTFDKKYNVVDIIYSYGDNTNQAKKCIRCHQGYNYRMESIGQGYLRYRDANFTTAGKIVFGKGYFGQAIASMYESNLQCIPCKIYGYVM